jgi:hypothetical protein
LAAGQAAALRGEPLDTAAIAEDDDPWFGYGWCFSMLMTARAELGEHDFLSDPRFLVQQSWAADDHALPLEVGDGGVEPEFPTEGPSCAEWAVGIVASEAFMWLMAGANHPEVHLNALREAYERYKASGGKVWGSS